MDFSKLKLDIYDFLGVILPGLLGMAEGWILLRGWHDLINSMTHSSGTELTLLLVISFGIGHLVQELGDLLVRVLKGDRYLLRGRDEFWRSQEARLVKQTIKRELGHEINSVDGAYDYCLTRLKGQFDKRGVFVATSDLCRSLLALSLIGLVPICRIAFSEVAPMPRSVAVLCLALVCLTVSGSLSWRRMNRFRRLSEATVFRAYLGLNHDDAAAAPAVAK